MLIEARQTWEDDVLAVVHVRAHGVVRLGELGLAGFDGDPTVIFEAGQLSCDAARGHGTIVWLSLVAGDRLPAGELGELRTTKGVALAAVLHATVLAMAFLGRGEPSETERLDAMRTYLAASEARVREELLPGMSSAGPGDGVSSKPEPSGTAGAPLPTKTPGLFARSKVNQEHERHRDPLAEARDFGIIGLISASRPDASQDPFAAYEGPSAMGSIFGTTIHDAFGNGGAGLSGTGFGGGGEGEGIGLTQPGGATCGPGPCAPAVSSGGARQHGFAHGVGRLGGSHRTGVVTCRCGETQVNGRLPPEAVQRIVRQNFGRLRLCYEAGLTRNPGLEGRIRVKFVIDRAGAVAMVGTGERDVADSDVASCVERAFSSMSFPEPEGGIVTVVYPLVLSTSP